jgi:hypothetical protein
MGPHRGTPLPVSATVRVVETGLGHDEPDEQEQPSDEIDIHTDTLLGPIQQHRGLPPSRRSTPCPPITSFGSCKGYGPPESA